MIDNEKIELFSDKSNPNEIFFGGRILQVITRIAMKVATRHASVKCRLVGIDFIRFFTPAKKEDISTKKILGSC